MFFPQNFHHPSAASSVKMFDSPKSFILALFVRFRLARFIDLNKLSRSLNLFKFPHSSFVFSVGFNLLKLLQSLA